MPEPSDQVFLTRFNLPSEGVESTIRTREGWLAGRVKLFETYCLPSIRAQQDATIRWLIYFDPNSPKWLRKWIDQNAGAFTPIYRSTVPLPILIEDIEYYVRPRSGRLITTNIDNDDGLAVDFSMRLRNIELVSPTTAVYFAEGLIKSTTGLYLQRDRLNAFCSVAEPWDENVLTCWADWHNRLHVHMPVHVEKGEPAWLQVVHGSNVSNRTRGKLVSPRPYSDLFVGLEGCADPAPRELFRDRFVARPIRGTRDTARTSLRKGGVALLGKDGFTDAKMRINTLRRHVSPGTSNWDSDV